MGKLTINYPEFLPDVLHESRDQFEQEAKMALAVKLFELKRIPSGTAAELAGIDRVAFLLKLHEFGVPMIDFDESELARDLGNA